jgi:hypothetical protein
VAFFNSTVKSPNTFPEDVWAVMALMENQTSEEIDDASHLSLAYLLNSSYHLTSVPGSRDAPRRETNLQFKYLKSRPCQCINLLSIYHCSSTISPLGNRSAMRK